MARKGFLALLAGVGLTIAVVQPTLAQQAPSGASLLKDPQSQDPLSNLFNNRSDNATGGLFELMQRVSQGNVDPEAFRQQQRETLDAETAKFLAQQRRLLQAQPQTAPAANPVAR